MSVYRFISAEKARTPVSVCCRLLGVSRSGFYDWAGRAPSDRQLTDAWLVEQIKRIHAENRGVYGARRVHAELRLAEGVFVGRKRVERLMRHAGISGLIAKKRGKTTIRVPGVRVADDLVERQFRPAAPNVLWVADITYLRTREGWLYLAAVQDAFSRRIVGWAMADHMRAELVVDALQMALARRRPGPGLVHHSDQGSQGGFSWSSQRLIERGCDGREETGRGPGWTTGDAYDNAMAKSFVDTFKTELIADRVWRTRPQLELAIVEWVGWYNARRLHEALGDIPPVEFELEHALAAPSAASAPDAGHSAVALRAPAPRPASDPAPTVHPAR